MKHTVLQAIKITVIGMCLLTACTNPQPPVTVAALSPQEAIQVKLNELKNVAKPGDLVVRLSDDLLSNQISRLNDSDKTYSHCGLIIINNGQKFVCHVAPSFTGNDTIQYTPIDSFLNPQTEIKAALYRYNFGADVIDSVLKIIKTNKQHRVVFDRHYDFSTNDKMYCSEMIAKAIDQATGNRIRFKMMTIPPKMQKIVRSYFQKEAAMVKKLPEGKYVPIDGLYLIPACTLITALTLKYFPGQ